MKITVSVKSELSLGNLCNQEFSSLKQLRNGSTSGSSHLKTNKNHLMKNWLLSWSDITICSMFHFSMSSYQNSGWASFLFYGLCSKQAIENTFIHTQKMVLWNSLLCETPDSKELPLFKECSANSCLKHPWRTVEHIDINSNLGYPWDLNCFRLGSYINRKVSLCVCMSLLFSL